LSLTPAERKEIKREKAAILRQIKIQHKEMRRRGYPVIKDEHKTWMTWRFIEIMQRLDKELKCKN